MHDPSFVPVGLPHDASASDAVDERIGFHLLAALESLDAVYKSAAYFAGVGAETSLGDTTLARCLEAVHGDRGALYLWHGEHLQLAAERGAVAGTLVVAELAAIERAVRPTIHQADETNPLLLPDAPPCSALSCPITVGTRSLGIVVLLAPPDRPLSTADAKLVAAVTSQAAIALARARHHNEAEVERKKLSMVVQNHPDGIVVLDASGKTTLCNPIARELCGGDDVLACLATAEPPTTMQALSQGNGSRELTLTAGGQPRIVKVRSREIRANDGTLANVILTLRDLTRQRREERLKRHFLSLISHKLRTPLTALVCALQMMEGADPEDRATFTAEMQARTEDLAALIDRLFGFAELLEGSWSTGGTADLGAMRDELTTFYAAQAAIRPNQLVWDLVPDALATPVPIPASRLRVALHNLIDNAIKFSGTPCPWVRVSARRTGDSLALAVEDRGPGIPRDERADLFATFHQIDTEFTGNVPGAGVGLAMVREIATRLGGSLDLTDAEPHGAVFTLSFPLPQEPARA